MANLLTDEEIMNEVCIRGLSIKKKNKEVYIIDDCWNIIKEFAGICDYGINFKNLNTIATAKIVDIYFENSYKGYCHIDNVIQNNKVHKHGAKSLKKDVLKLVCNNKYKEDMMIEIGKITQSVKQKGVKVGDDVFIGFPKPVIVRVYKIGTYKVYYQKYKVDKRVVKIEPSWSSSMKLYTIKNYYTKELQKKDLNCKTEDFNLLSDEDFKRQSREFYVSKYWE